MGRFDRRLGAKSRRRRAQAAKKERIQRRAEEVKAQRAQKKK